MTKEITAFEIYSPASILGIFSNALKLPVTVNLIFLKGKYVQGNGKAYANYYYDYFYSESDSTSIGVKVSGLLRSTLTNNEIYTLKGFVEKKIKNSSIELVFAVDEVVKKEEKSISEDELHRYELIQRKIEIGSRDLESLIRSKKLKNESIKIANIYGHNAIVQKDFYQSLDVSQREFEIQDFTCNITSATSITDKLLALQELNFDIIAIVRGGGDTQSYDAFKNVNLAETFINSNALTITAIGHAVDDTLIDKLADKKFHLPFDYGKSLHEIIEKLSQEKQNSRNILIEEVKKDLSKQFEEQVKTLSSQLQKKNEEFQKFQEHSTKQFEELNKNHVEQQKNQLLEMENYKKDITALHNKNILSAVNEKTAQLNANYQSLLNDNTKLKAELKDVKPISTTIITVIVISFLAGLIISLLIK